MDFTIRQATVEDVDRIVIILQAHKAATVSVSLSDPAQDAAQWRHRWIHYLRVGSAAQQSLGDGFAFLAEREGRAVGFAAYHHTRRHNTQAELQSIYVLEGTQGRGVGTALLRLIAARLMDEGTRTMCVGYDPRNAYKRFYFKHGAVEVDPHWAVWEDVSTILRPG